MRIRRGGALLALGLMLLCLTLILFGRTSPIRHHAVPPELQVQAHLPGFPQEVRYFPRDPGDIKLIEKEFLDSWERESAAQHTRDLPPAAYLAISGGGDKGAFSAGFLNGWTASGTRPTFKLVTGVSTGALIAPFAFLGPAYDESLKEIYTGVSQKDIAAKRFFYSVFMDDALSDTTPLARLLGMHVTRKMLDDIAAEYAKGRLLLIGTTNLDARRPVIWNVTKIAASHRPEALELVRKIMLASAAIPGAFPPVMFEVEADGKPYEEMHVDGGATTQVFVYWAGVRLKLLSEGAGIKRDRRIYIIVNARLDPEWGEVERRTLPITFKAIETLLEFQAMGDLFRIYAITQRDGTDFNLAYVPDEFKAVHADDFDNGYMKQLYRFGFDKASQGYDWLKQPPMQVGDTGGTQ